MTAPAYTPSTPGDAEDWRCSPDLMSLDEKLDAVFGKLDAAGKAAETLLLIGTADIERGAK